MSGIAVAGPSSGLRYSTGFSERTSMPKSPPSPYGRPPTEGQLSSKTPTDMLTPMPDYMRPVTKSASKRYRKLHEDHMMAKLMDRRKVKKEQNKATREEVQKIVRKIPMEILAKSWMKESNATVETRAFLVDKVLPTLILGVEKLLMEVDKRELADCDKPDANFNPINFLAQYLMRNNPKYSSFSEASPYIRGLREVGEELKQQLFDIDENRLARIKAEARKKREERELEERLQLMEKERRHEALKEQFKDWNVGRYTDFRVDLALLQNALRSFAEISQQYPENLRKAAALSHELEATDDTGKTLGLREFVQYLEQFIQNMPAELFNLFIQHLSHCAHSFRSQAQREQRKVILSEVFKSCDHTGVSLVDRHRILDLFEMFYDKALNYIKQTLRNPRKWPVVEPHEMVDSLVDSDDEEESLHDQDPKFIDNNIDVTAQENTKTSKDTPREETADTEKNEAQKDEESVIQKEEKNKIEPEDKKEQEPAQEDTKVADQDKPDEERPKEENVPESESKPEESEADKDEKTEAETKPTEATEETPEEQEAPGPEQEGRSPGGLPHILEEDEEDLVSSAENNDTKDADNLEPELSPLTEEGLRPPMTQQSKVSFAEGTTFEKEHMLLTSQGTRSHSQASAFDENTLNPSQFVHLIETFLGDDVDMDAFAHLVRYIREGYMETEEERLQRIMKARAEANMAKRKALLNSLFEMWDNDGSGFLDVEEVETVMKKYKDGMENAGIAQARQDLKKKNRYHDSRLSKREFRDFVYSIVANMPGGTDENFDYFVEFLLNSVERSYTERVRGEARKKWLQQIITSAETSGGSMEPIYKAVFQALYKDAEAHGGGKVISANISLLERNRVSPLRGDTILRYVATTPEDAPWMLGKVLFKDMKGISFAAVESGKPIHVPRVNNHGNIHFWNTDRDQEERDGSFIIVPLKDRRKRVFGLLGIDTLNDPRARAIFITHEIQFFQGIAKAFSIAYHHVDIRQKTMRISESAVSWIQRRCPHVREIAVYMMEPEAKLQDYVLRKMMVTDHKANAHVLQVPPRLERKDNLFRLRVINIGPSNSPKPAKRKENYWDYLFKCVDNSESVTADAYGERHLAFPLRDDEGRAIVVIDVSIGAELKSLPKAETKEIMKMLKLLQLAYKEITLEQHEDEKPEPVLKGEKKDDDSRTEILFDRLMLNELRENVSRLDAKAYAELKSYKEPPPVVHFILKAVLAVFYPDKALSGELEDWHKCKAYVNPALSSKIMAFDPTADDNFTIPLETIHVYFEAVPHGQVSKFGSIPAQYLYNWVFVCVSMIEHSRKMKDAEDKDMDAEGDKPDEESCKMTDTEEQKDAKESDQTDEPVSSEEQGEVKRSPPVTPPPAPDPTPQDDSPPADTEATQE